MTPQQNISTDKKRREMATALNQFYANPVARTSTELFLTIGLVLFLAVFAIKPTITTMSELIREIETKTKLEGDLTKKIAALQTAQTQYLNTLDQFPLLEEAIPAQPEIIMTAKIIEKIAAETQIVIQNLNFSSVPENTTKDVLFSQKSRQLLKISLSVTGDYNSIRGFVESLRNSRKSFIVESIVFSLQEDRGGKKLSANLTIAAPYFGVAQQTGTKR